MLEGFAPIRNRENYSENFGLRDLGHLEDTGAQGDQAENEQKRHGPHKQRLYPAHDLVYV